MKKTETQKSQRASCALNSHSTTIQSSNLNLTFDEGSKCNINCEKLLALLGRLLACNASLVLGECLSGVDTKRTRYEHSQMLQYSVQSGIRDDTYAFCLPFGSLGSILAALGRHAIAQFSRQIVCPSLRRAFIGAQLTRLRAVSASDRKYNATHTVSMRTSSRFTHKCWKRTRTHE